MDVLCFSTFAKNLKEVCKNTVSDPDVIDLLFFAVVEPTGLKNKLGEAYVVDKKVASKLMTRTANIPQDIRNAITDKRVSISIHDYFSKSVLPKLMPGLELDLIQNLSTLIQDDMTIPQGQKDKLLSNARIETLGIYLADIFVYTIKKNNNTQKKNDTNAEIASEIVPNLSAMSRFTQLQTLEVPHELEGIEIPYITELLAAYGEAENVSPFTKDMLPLYSKYRSHYARQRKDFYAAEAVRRGTRETYSDDNQFEVLKEETYDGVVDVLEQEYVHGYARLSAVLTQAAQIKIDRCWICRDTDWIGNSQKKGVCHVLVNDGKIKGWVNKHE